MAYVGQPQIVFTYDALKRRDTQNLLMMPYNQLWRTSYEAMM